MCNIQQEKGKWYLRRGNRKYKCMGAWNVVTCFRDWYLEVSDRAGEMAGNEAGKTEWGEMRLRMALGANLNNLDLKFGGHRAPK